MIMRKLIEYFEKNLRKFAKAYQEAMKLYGEAIMNSRGLVGA